METSLKPIRPNPEIAEAQIIANEAAATFGQMVRFYVEHYQLTPDEARKRASEPGDDTYAEDLKRRPPDQTSWFDLQHIARGDEAGAMMKWKQVKEAALGELQTGHRAAKTLEPHGTHCWDRAKFLALRYDLSEEWAPRNGMERQLIDTMALAQASFLFWLERTTTYATLESWRDKEAKEQGRWAPPRVTDADAVEQAGAMADRFNRMFMRSLRALRDLRRYPVIVQNAGQVNIGDKQVNVTAS